MLSFTDRVVLITGAAGGLGEAYARGFAARGASLLLNDLADSNVEALATELGGIADTSTVATREGGAAIIEHAADAFGRLDVVVNNAGGSPYVPATEASAKFSTKIIELNLLGPLSVSTHANAVMQTQAQGGSIVNIASVSGRRPTPGTVAYGAAKAGLENITSTLAVEWAPKVRVNSVVVGMVETEQSELFYGDADSIAAIAKNVPLGRLAKPADVGWAAAFLASDAASYISGASLEVHGGGEPPHYLSTTTADIK